MPRFKLCPRGHKHQEKRCPVCEKDRRVSYEARPERKAARAYYNTPEWLTLRKACGERDHFVCQDCGEPTGKSYHADHIVAREAGGGDTLDNLQTLCRPCHSRKTMTEMHEDGRL